MALLPYTRPRVPAVRYPPARDIVSAWPSGTLRAVSLLVLFFGVSALARRRGLAAVSRTRWPGAFQRAWAAYRVERDAERRLETPVDGLGWSSPVIVAGQVWMTTAIADEGSLKAVCLDAKSGQQISYIDVFHKDDLGPIHIKNSHASPTPVIEGNRVYVHFGRHGTACLSTDGEVLWRNQELAYDHRHGPAGSPVLWQDLLIVSCDGTDKQFVVALDKKTGEIRWRTDRNGRMAYSTPLAIRVDGVRSIGQPRRRPGRGLRTRHGGRDLAFPLRRLLGRAPPSLWSRPGFRQFQPTIRPCFTRFVCLDEGDITETAAAWSLRRGRRIIRPRCCWATSYTLSATSASPRASTRSTGEQHWQSRLGGGFSASPARRPRAAIYFTNEEGLTTVMEAGTE